MTMRLSDTLPKLPPLLALADTPAGAPPAGRPATGQATAEARRWLSHMGNTLPDCTRSDYWAHYAHHVYWSCVTDLCTAADIVGDDNLPDVPVPRKAGDPPLTSIADAVIEFGRAVLADTLIAVGRRPTTPPRTVTVGGQPSTVHVVQRACNGCGRRLGDSSPTEIAAAIDGRPLPDVRQECPACRAES